MPQSPLPSALQHLNHIFRALPICISPMKVMEILSLAAWPLVILFHRPAPRWSQHNGRRSTSSQSIFWQTWSSKLVSFGKGMTKDLFNTLTKSIKTSEQHVSFFFVLYFPPSPLCVTSIQGSSSCMCFLQTASTTVQRSKVKMAASHCVIQVFPWLVVKVLLHDIWLRLVLTKKEQ